MAATGAVPERKARLRTGAGARARVGACLMATVLLGSAMGKILGAPPSSQTPWWLGGVTELRMALIAIEIAFALLLLAWPSLVLWRLIQGGLVAAVVLHGLYVLKVGADAPGCGCLGGAGPGSAGLDALAVSLTLLVSLGAMQLGSRSSERLRLLAWPAFVLLIAVVAFGGALLPRRADRGSAADTPLSDGQSLRIDAPHLQGAGAAILDGGAEGPHPSMVAASAMRSGPTEVAVAVVDGRSAPIRSASLVTITEREGGLSIAAQEAVLTDEDGLAVLPLPVGAIGVRASHPDFETAVVSLRDLRSGSRGLPTLEVSMRRGHALRVQMSDASAHPIVGGRVRLSPIANHVPLSTSVSRVDGALIVNEVLEAVTDAEGIAAFTGLSETFYRVEPSPDGGLIRIGRGEATYVSPSDEVVRMTVAPIMSCWLRAVDVTTGQPVASAVWFPDREAPGTGALGAARFDRELSTVLGLAALTLPSDYLDARASLAPEGNREPVSWGTIGVMAPGYEPTTVDRVYWPKPQGSACSNTVIPLRRREGATYGTLRIRAPDGLPFPRGAVLEVWPEYTEHVRRNAITRRLPQGETNYLLAGLCSGRYAYRASGSKREMEFEISAGEECVVALELDALALVKLTVTREGSPYDGFIDLYVMATTQNFSMQEERIVVRRGVSEVIALPADMDLSLDVTRYGGGYASLHVILDAGRLAEYQVEF